jgi:uncharacterized membrane protein YdbT with pleckstrin-like domain
MQDVEPAVERIMYQSHPAMFKARPLLFILFVLLVGLLLVGLILLAIWWVWTRAVTLTVTARCTRLQTGLLSRVVKEVRHWDVRYIEVRQGFLQRLMNVGTINISSAAQADTEIVAPGMPDPMKVKDLVDAGRLAASG